MEKNVDQRYVLALLGKVVLQNEVLQDQMKALQEENKTLQEKLAVPEKKPKENKNETK